MGGTLRPFWQVVLVCTVCSFPRVVSAQTLGGTRPQLADPAAQGALTAFRTALDITTFSGSDADARYNWDVDLLLDADLFDVGFVRGNLLANLETIVGSEFRNVDPNQNNYVVDFSILVRLPRGEIGTTFHHVSRHLSDRPDQGSVSWNMIGVSYADRFDIGPLRVDAGVRGLGTVERAGVDYTAQFEWHSTFELDVTRRVSIIAGGDGVIVPVESEVFMRTTRRGGLMSAGLRFPTPAGAVDLFIGWEQRIDAGQFSHDTVRWMQVGVRLSAAVP